MSTKAIMFAFALCTVPIASLAQEYEKNGQPCVAEICLGDGIAELSKIQWDNAKESLSLGRKKMLLSEKKISEENVKALRSKFRGNLGSAEPFLSENKFDSVGLSPLSRVSVACVRNELIGTYTTQSGNPTKVRISLIPHQDDSTKQRWTVVFISRSFPAAVSQEQIAEIRAQLKERYHAFSDDRRIKTGPKPGDGRFLPSIFQTSAEFQLSLFIGLDVENRMKLHPDCGGTTKVSID